MFKAIRHASSHDMRVHVAKTHFDADLFHTGTMFPQCCIPGASPKRDSSTFESLNYPITGLD